MVIFYIDNTSIRVYNYSITKEAISMISLAEYAALHGKSPVSVRQMAARGGFQTAQKIARNWIIDENEPYPDGRVKTGKYIGWRKNERGQK